LHSVDCECLEGELVYTRDALSLVRLNFDGILPLAFALTSVYPNPFNSQTRITFEVPERGEISFKVFDQTGREVFSSPQSMREAGTQSFEWNARGLPSGSYLFKLYYGDKVQSAKLVLVK
ncbi:MAG TPA: T9SS type A sorting domain-containing protein, partial [Anaerolineae bacterium]|nr:T9SS type A sorting domain-containing protein [Anaerolineae bacterium]